ncbi:hypothetical protein ACFZCY_20225 [Streptomyces sp. NPDC007983]|uniref:hypothetical protein n=1 Tax=Streptomyces sp. NPDC007983 TaxID=3364800 RepID=UPI0036E5755B
MFRHAGRALAAVTAALTCADSGRNGHTVTWRGRSGQAPVLSGALRDRLEGP